MQVLKTKVLIKSDGKNTERESGIITNISVDGGLRRGTVESVGSQVRDVKVGDRVCWSVESGNIVNRDGQEYALMHETEIIGWLENEVQE